MAFGSGIIFSDYIVSFIVNNDVAQSNEITFSDNLVSEPVVVAFISENPPVQNLVQTEEQQISLSNVFQPNISISSNLVDVSNDSFSNAATSDRVIPDVEINFVQSDDVNRAGDIQNPSVALTYKVVDLPSHQLLWFLASIYFDPGFELLISQR